MSWLFHNFCLHHDYFRLLLQVPKGYIGEIKSGRNHMKRVLEKCCPQAGKVYRDILGRSFMVIFAKDHILVEYATGELRKLLKTEWLQLEPKESLF